MERGCAYPRFCELERLPSRIVRPRWSSYSDHRSAHACLVADVQRLPERSRHRRADTDADYFAYVDGKPRYEGVASATWPAGVSSCGRAGLRHPGPTASAGWATAERVLQPCVLARDGIAPYPGSLRLLDYLAAVELPMAVVSSSRNAEAVLDAAGLVDYFTVVMDGNLGHQLGLRASRRATMSFVPRSCWVSRWRSPSCSRMRCRVWQPGPPAGSAWSWASTVVLGPMRLSGGC